MQHQIWKQSIRVFESKIVQLLRIEKDQKVAAMIAVDKFDDDTNLLLLTKKGWMKQVKLEQFQNCARRPGLLAIPLVILQRA